MGIAPPDFHGEPRSSILCMEGAVVCGAGTAGLAAAATLRGVGVDAIVLERANQVGASWRNRYDGLRLNTAGWMSTQPGFRASRRRYGEYPSRDKWIQYLEDYAAHHRIDIRFGTEVQHVDRLNGGWRVETDRGGHEAQSVVVATGFDHDADLPEWPGRDGFAGDLIHSSSYRNPEPYRGRDVLVVGPGVTGSEVACLVAKGGARRVRIACRTPPNLITRKFMGASVNISGIALNRLPLRAADEVGWLVQRILFGKLDRYGLPRAPEGMATTLSRRQQAPAYDDGFVAEVKAGRIEVVPAVEAFDGPEEPPGCGSGASGLGASSC